MTYAALGLFDGVHLGHRAVLGRACERHREGLVPVAFTFPPETAAGKSGGEAGYIYGEKLKHRLMKECGIVDIICPPFDEVRGLTGEEFARDILAGRMNAVSVCCGSDFRFGRGASCGTDELKKFGERFGFRVNIVPDVGLGGETVSSSRIRELLTQGDIVRANELLGEPYTICAPVAHGSEIGRTIGYPTANQLFEVGQLVPRAGAYVSETLVDGTWRRSMTNIGVKPTVGYDGRPLAETYITDFSGDIYGSELNVRLLEFIRPEERFGSVEELREQIAADIEKCR